MDIALLNTLYLIALPVAVLSAVASGIYTRHENLVRFALIMLGEWISGYVYSRMVVDYDPWEFLMATFFIAAVLIIKPSRILPMIKRTDQPGRIEAVLALGYAAAIWVCATYGFDSLVYGAGGYYEILSFQLTLGYIGLFMLSFLFIGSIINGARHYRNIRSGHHDGVDILVSTDDEEDNSLSDIRIPGMAKTS